MPASKPHSLRPDQRDRDDGERARQRLIARQPVGKPCAARNAATASGSCACRPARARVADRDLEVAFDGGGRGGAAIRTRRASAAAAPAPSAPAACPTAREVSSVNTEISAALTACATASSMHRRLAEPAAVAGGEGAQGIEVRQHQPARTVELALPQQRARRRRPAGVEEGDAGDADRRGPGEQAARREVHGACRQRPPTTAASG